MNERIQELAEQSGLYHQLAKGSPYPSAMTAEECDFAYDKFAQLIIQECVQVVENVAPGYPDYRSQIEESMRNFCVAAIKRHFEIKE